MKTFNDKNLTKITQLSAALKDIFGGIKGRNNQLQQVLIVSVNEAAKKDKNGDVVNNLDWLSMVITQSETTPVIKAKIKNYIMQVLCQGTVKFDAKKQRLVKKDKDTPIKYSTNPMLSWFDKEDKEKKATNWKQKAITALKSAQDEEKGGLTAEQMAGVLIEGGITQDVLDILLERLVGDAAAAQAA